MTRRGLARSRPDVQLGGRRGAFPEAALLLLYLVIVLLGAALTVRLATWRSRHAWAAGAGTLLGVLAVLGGFSIGPLVAPVALLVLALAAAAHLRRRNLGA